MCLLSFHPIQQQKLHYDQHLFDCDFDVMSEIISGRSRGGPMGVLSPSLNFIRSIILDRSFGEIIPMPCSTTEAIMAADSINATSTIACFYHSDCKVVVIFFFISRSYFGMYVLTQRV